MSDCWRNCNCMAFFTEWFDCYLSNDSQIVALSSLTTTPTAGRLSRALPNSLGIYQGSALRPSCTTFTVMTCHCLPKTHSLQSSDVLNAEDHSVRWWCPGLGRWFKNRMSLNILNMERGLAVLPWRSRRNAMKLNPAPPGLLARPRVLGPWWAYHAPLPAISRTVGHRVVRNGIRKLSTKRILTPKWT